MTPADLEWVVELEQSLQSHPWKPSHFENCLAIGNLALVVEYEKKAVAFAIVSIGGGEAELLNIGVAQDYQGQGLATSFLGEILTQLKDQAQAVFLEVRESNHKAIALYEKLGFNQTGVRPNYYPAKQGREDAYIYALELTSLQ